MKYAFALLLLIFLATTLPAQQIRINELFYNPPGGDTDFEWIEFYNSGDVSINLNQWKIETAGLVFTEDFTFPDVIIGSEEFFVIGGENVPQADIVFELDLQNGGTETDGVRLMSANGDTVDTILFDFPNLNNLPGDANQPGIYFATNVDEGNSLIRFPDGNDTNNCEQDFFDCSSPTPGSPNSLMTDLGILSLITLPENPDSLDNIIISFQIQNNSQVPVYPQEWNFIIFLDGILFSEGNYPSIINAQENITITENIGTLISGYHLLNVEINFPEDDIPENNLASISILIGKSPLIINEFLYYPQSPNLEWVEIYNRSEYDYNLFSWKIKDSGTNWNSICTDKLIPAGGFAVITEDTTAVKNFYNDSLLLFQTEGWSNLNNSSPDAVVFADSSLSILDSVYYDPAYCSCSANFSLERLDPYSNLPDNWAVCTDTSGATPGKINSVTPATYDLSAVSLQKNVVGANISLLAVCKNVGFENIENAQAIIFLDDFNEEYEESELLYSTDISLESGDSLEISFSLEELDKSYYKFGLFVDCANDMKPENDQTFTTYNSPQNYPVCVNEIMSSPSENEPEWLELFHDFSYPLRVSSWQIGDYSDTLNIEAQNIWLPPDEYLILLSDLSDSIYIKDKYFYQVPYPLNFAAGLPSLNNTDDKLVLLDEYGSRIDSVYYHSDWGEVENNSLERVNPSHDSNESANWESSVAEFGATPGMQNSIFVQKIDPEVQLSMTPNPISLREKRSVLIEYNLPEVISEVNVRVFDVKGRLIRLLADQDWVATTGSLLWDCKNGKGKVMPVGIYIIHFEAGGKHSGKVYYKTKTMVIGEK